MLISPCGLNNGAILVTQLTYSITWFYASISRPPNLCLAPNLYLLPWPKIFIYRPWPTIFISSPVSELAYTNLVPPIYIYWTSPTICINGPGYEFAFTILLVVVAVVVVILAVVVISLE